MGLTRNRVTLEMGLGSPTAESCYFSSCFVREDHGMRTRPLRSRARITTVLATAITGTIALVVTGAPSVVLASSSISTIMPHT